MLEQRAASPERITYDYDDAGNRTSKSSTSPSGQTTTTARSYNDANELCWTQASGATSGCSSPLSGRSFE